jgi:hypothetical protein
VPVYDGPAVVVTVKSTKYEKQGSFLHSDTAVNTAKNSVNISQIQNVILRCDFEEHYCFRITVTVIREIIVDTN